MFSIPFVEPCFSRVDIIDSKQKTLYGKQTPDNGNFEITLDEFCPRLPVSFFVGGKTNDDVATLRLDDTTNQGLLGHSPIAPRHRIPREGSPHFDVVFPEEPLEIHLFPKW